MAASNLAIQFRLWLVCGGPDPGAGRQRLQSRSRLHLVQRTPAARYQGNGFNL